MAVYTDPLINSRLLDRTEQSYRGFPGGYYKPSSPHDRRLPTVIGGAPREYSDLRRIFAESRIV